MTYQQELIKNLTDELEKAVERNLKHPCIFNAQKVSEAKHAIMEFLNAK